MDPFSIVVGVGSLLQFSLELGKYLKDVHEAIASFEDEIGSFMREIQDLDSVNNSIEQLYRTESANHIFGQTNLPRQDFEIWQNIVKTLQDCSKTIQTLQSVLEAITGKNGPKPTGWRDSIKKQLKKQAKDGELNHIRLKLSTYRGSLNVSLTLLNLIYTQKGSKDIQVIGFQLHKQIAALQSRLPLTEAETLHESLQSATAFASTLRLNRHFDTPKTVSRIYTGRKGYLDGLKQAYDSSYASSTGTPLYKRFVVFGLGGSGKTQFCCKFAADNKQRFWGIFTVDASSPGNAQQSFIAIAKACGTDPNERAAKSWLSSSDRPWLLLIDNANDINLDIEKYFPDGEHGLTLITTRNPSVKMHGTIGQRFYHFDRLEDAEARELLLKAADNERPWTSTTMQLASAITRKLGALPLALIHAGNAIKARYCEMSDYLAYYEDRWQIIRQNQRSIGRDEDDAEYMEVYASYEIVFRGLEAIKMRKYKDAVQLLKLFSFFHHEHIPFEVLVAAVKHPRIQREAEAQEAERIKNQMPSARKVRWQPSFWPKQLLSLVDILLKKQFELQNPVILPTFLHDAELCRVNDNSKIRLRDALHLLTQLSLVTFYEASDSYSMHPLVHTWVRERPEMTVRDQAVWCEAALHTLSRSILLPPLNETVDPHGDLARKLLPHIISVGKFQRKIEQDFASNRYRRSNPWPALQARLSPSRAMFLAKCALVYVECGDFVAAEKSLRIVMEFNRNLFGPHHPRTERVTLVVSDCLWQQCRVNEAADLQEEVYSGNVRVLGPDHPRTLRLMDKLGESRRQQGRFAESIELLTKAMAGMQSQLPETDPARYRVLEQLGTTLRACYQYEDARRHQEQAVAGLKRCLGDNDIRTLVAMEDLAITYKELSTMHTESNKAISKEYLEAAHKHATFVVEQCKKQLGDKQPHTWMAQGTLGRINAAMGDVDGAERIFTSILPVAARHLGDDHLGVLSHKGHYSKILIQQKRYQEAETILVEISRPAKYNTATSTGDHPDRWDALWTLVDCYQKQGKMDYSLATCNNLLRAVSAIQEGKQQTETSRAFWRMVQDRRAELMIVRGLDSSDTTTSMMIWPPPHHQRLAALHSGMQVKSTGSELMPTMEVKHLKVRGTTW